MNRPMLIVAVWFIAGIVAGQHIMPAAPLWPWLTLSFLLPAIAMASDRHRKFLLPSALLVAGITALLVRTAVLSPTDLRRVLPTTPTLASVRGELVETPFQRAHTDHNDVRLNTQAELEVHSVRLKDGDWQPAEGRLAVSTPGTVGAPFYAGRAVEIDGVIRPPRGSVAEGTFDYATHLAHRGIYFQFQAGAAGDWRSLDPESETRPPPWSDRFAVWARESLARGLPAEDEPLRLLWTMTLGWRTGLTGEIAEPFMRSGTMHVFAISGLHIALIATLLVAFLRVCRLPRAWCGLVVIPLIWLYTGVTGWQSSAIRSTVMMSVIIAGWSLQRPSDLINSLSVAAVLLLAWDPLQLFQPSFQLSFSVVLSLALFGPAIEQVRRRIFQFDPWVPDDLRPRWQHWLRRPLDYLGTSFGVSLAAWIGSIPLVALYFHLFTPVSLIANLVVVPLSSGALACSLASLAVGPFVPLFGELFNHSAWFFMLLMMEASRWAAAANAGCFHVATPGPVFILTYYGVVLAIFSGALRRPPWRRRTILILTPLLLWCIGQWFWRQSETRLEVLPLSGGSAIYVRGTGPDHEWLIDCGDESSADFTLKAYLRGQGVNRLQNIVLTHGDIHHVGGAMVVDQFFRPRAAWFSAASFRSASYRSARTLFDSPPARARTWHRGDAQPPWKLLHPDDADRFPQADDNTMVLWGEWERVRLLLLSDLGKPGQNALLGREALPSAEIVLSGVPTQSEPVADALLETVRPQLLIITDAEYPASRRASLRLRERLARQTVPVLYTRETGALTLTLRDGAWTVRDMKGALISGRRGRE